jgi:hypothetical protein
LELVYVLPFRNEKPFINPLSIWWNSGLGKACQRVIQENIIDIKHLLL